MSVKVANVNLWGSTIGAVSWDADRELAAFEYTRPFQRSGIDIAPLMMPLGSNVYTFAALDRRSFYGLPGLLADSLPDKFGNLLIDEWLVRNGRDRASFTPVERLCYVGTRGMGALEFAPSIKRESNRSLPIDIAALVELASLALAQKEQLDSRFAGEDAGDLKAMREIIRVGTSAGGARAKAVIAWNQETNEVRSGQVEAPPGFDYWLLKFDGVSGNRDKELDDPQGYGQIEYAYYLMALDAGVEMSECRLFKEHGRNHFVTKRFDRGAGGEKIFMQSLCALGHYDFNQAGAYSYEQAIQIAKDLDLSTAECEQLFRRAVFNIIARNQDDHTKNIAFLMDGEGGWRLAPAFDVTYSYNPQGLWTNQHQMSLNGKRDDFFLQDFRTAADRFRLFRGKRLDEVLEQVDAAIDKWPEFAARAGVPTDRTDAIARNQRPIAKLPLS